ncbi:PREDICTED: probable G-protein coupled receptor 160 [Thamnophis sirtalis]|uniref:Probable G-protein coupled receptor 160 n=1 Tax=Thamnophis sirtalis TaxID=35019 RepID=A0A6I9XDJ0_9SAUR|nr:PREDICTED: probable G-protein coupled receptor 160 [Thamnophis sirtalis]XP_013912276.1 PREDICTED: probable G-protein coupled receptor 160 [Thamnophis sirtalis]
MIYFWKQLSSLQIIMAAIISSLFLNFKDGHDVLPSEANGALLLVMLGKVSLNFFLLQARKNNHHQSFMSYFCISLAIFDLLLLGMMTLIFCNRNILIGEIRFTEYHICLLPQIISLVYGILHYPVFLIAGLDYCFTIAHTSNYKNKCWKALYTIAVILTWISALGYILNLRNSSLWLNINNDNYGHQCPFYISSQTYWLSLGMLTIICLVLVFCWSEILNMVQSTKLISFEGDSVLLFPYELEGSSRGHSKCLLARLLISFMGTWTPFVVLQMLIVLLNAKIPAHIEMNVPWLYFVNSFLIGIACWVRGQDIVFPEDSWDVDPFVSWKFCFIPFSFPNTEKAVKPDSEITIC